VNGTCAKTLETFRCDTYDAQQRLEAETEWQSRDRHATCSGNEFGSELGNLGGSRGGGEGHKEEDECELAHFRTNRSFCVRITSRFW
jgi:hypothetical protein